MIIQIYHLIQ